MSTATAINCLAVLRIYRSVVRYIQRFAARWIGQDETTPAAEREAAARYRAVADAPIPEETRLRVEHETRMGGR